MNLALTDEKISRKVDFARSNMESYYKQYHKEMKYKKWLGYFMTVVFTVLLVGLFIYSTQLRDLHDKAKEEGGEASASEGQIPVDSAEDI